MKKSTDSKKYTIGEWVDIWVEVYATSRCKSSTLTSYRDCRQRMATAYPKFEGIFLDELRPYEFQRCLNSLAEKYSKSTVSHVRSVYCQAYGDAVKNRLCQWNPIGDTAVPQSAGQKKVTALSQEEQQAFELALKKLPVPDQFVLQTFLLTGLRRGELAALVWDDWDKKRKVLMIRQSKTEKGIREVPVIPEVVLMLTHLQHVKKKENCPYIFSFHGRRVPNDHLRWICKKAARLAGIRHVHPHMLRHTFASRMVERKVDPKSLATIIGHTDVAFTMRTYVDIDQQHHLYEEMMCLSAYRGKGGEVVVE